VWGKDIPGLKGKTTRKKSTPVHRSEMKVPCDLLKLYRDVTMSIDIFFVTGIPFFLTLSHKIDFMGATHLENCKIVTIAKAFCEVYMYYYNCGFRITMVLADGEFAPLKQLIQSKPNAPTVKLMSRNEHVPEIKRQSG
jgi:hypothetical protein